MGTNDMNPGHSAAAQTRGGGWAAWLLLAGAAVLMAVFARPLFLRQVYVEDDLRAFYLPVRALYQQCLLEGDSFLWMPHLFNGFYLHGEGQACMLHPLHWLGYRFLPLDIGFNLEILTSYLLAFGGMVLLLRRWALPLSGCLFGALLCTFIGGNLNHYIHVNYVSALAHLPVHLALIDLAFRAERPRPRVAAAGGLLALTGLQLLHGCPQFTYFSWLAEMVYALVLAARTRRVRALLGLGAAKLLAMAVAAAQLLPTWDVLHYSYRAAPGMDFQLSISLHPLNLAQLLNAYLFHGRVFTPFKGDEPWDAPYMSAAALLLIALAALRIRTASRLRWQTVFALSISVFGLLAALGGYGFLYPVFDAIPVVNMLRAPARYVALANFGMAACAALGFFHLVRAAQGVERLSRREIWVLAAIPLASAVITMALFLWSHAEGLPGAAVLSRQLMRPAPLVLGGGIVATSAALTIAAGRGSRLALAGLLVFTLLEIGVYSLRHKPMATIEELLAEVDRPPAPPPARLDTDIHPIYMNRFCMLGYRQVYGYVSLRPARALDYTKKTPLRLAGVTWREARLTATPDVAEAARRGETWVRLDGAFPRARLAPEAVVSGDPGRDIEAVDLARTALVEAPLDLGGGAPGEARIISDRPGRIVIEVDAPSRQLLVVSESFHHGWRVSTERGQGAALRVYGDFIGYPVGPETETVVFAFRPASFVYGRWLSLAGIGLSLALLGGAFVLAERR